MSIGGIISDTLRKVSVLLPIIAENGENCNMRMRKKKNGQARIDACADYLIKSPDENVFNECRPLSLEIGCGKGFFACESAKADPNGYFIAVELSTDAIITALERARSEEIPNLRFINANASDLRDFIALHSVDVLYLNFSDPWHKSRHYKRRLTYRSFLEIYALLLADGGKLCFKTDNRALFDFSIEELFSSGWRIENLTYDLHNSAFAQTNIMTEYEKNFSEKGFKINRLVAYPPKK